MFHRTAFNLFTSLLLVFVLLMSTAHSEMPISASTSLDTFNYDLDNIHLKIEKFNANWQFSLVGGSRLWVDNLRAKRLIITIGNGKVKSPNNGLPERIQLPFPIKVIGAEVDELLVINNSETQTFSQVKLDIEADSKTIKINRLQAATPWGETVVAIEMQPEKPYALNGEVRLKGLKNSTADASESTIKYDTKLLLSGNLEAVRFQSKLQVSKTNQHWIVSSLEEANTPHAVQLNLNGQLSLNERDNLDAQIDVRDFNPAQLGDFPTAKLNMVGTIQATLSASPEATIKFAIRDSVWLGNDITSKGKLVIAGEQIRELDLEANIADNTFKAKGALGIGNKLIWQADLADLHKLHPAFAGQANLNGLVEGPKENLAFQISLMGNNIVLQSGLSISRLAGQANILADEGGALQGELSASKLQYGERMIQDSKVTLKGSRAQHIFNISAQGNEFIFTSVLSGAFIANTKRWQGVIEKLALDGQAPIKLITPAKLSMDAQSVNVSNAQFQLSKGILQVDLIKMDANGFSSAGHASQLNLADITTSVFEIPVNVTGDPIFSSKWDIRAEKSMNGYVSFWRDSGELFIIAADGAKKALGLSEVKFDLKVIENIVEINSQMKGEFLGNLTANLSTKLAKTNNGFALLGDAPMTLNAQADLNTLAWLPMPATFKDANFDGTTNIQVSANGTLSTPKLKGFVRGERLKLSLPSEGVNLTNGSLDAIFEQKQLLIKKATWQGGDGFINTSGTFLFEKANPSMQLDWIAENFTAISRADRLLILSGKGKTNFIKDELIIEGDFTVAKGLIELADEDKPSLGNDVVVLRQSKVSTEPALKVLLNGLRIDVGKDFKLHGRGLDAELTGAIKLTGLTVYRPYTEGVIQVKKGSFSAYGQALVIERGILNFNGTFDNPALNIRAMRNSKPVNAGVEITGTAFIPITKLVSEPEVAESEKLAWLVLGRGMDQSNKNDYGLLSLAAGVLLSQGLSVPLQTQLAQAAGLDELSIAGGDANSATVVFGKRVTSNMYLSYQKSISGLLDVARITYNMTSNWSLRGEAGTESAVDVLYTFSFK